MRIKAVFVSCLLLGAAVLSSNDAQARARGDTPFAMGASSVGYSGGAIIGAHASPYYVAPYGYAPAYYHGVPGNGYAGHGYGYVMPTYAHGIPYAYAVGAPCWVRRQAVYGTYGSVAGIRYEYVCQ